MNDLPENLPDRELDERMRRLVRASVDRRLGAERPAPRFDAGARRRPLPTWLLPLAVAASIAVLLGGTVGVVRLASGGPDDRIAPGQTSSVSPLQTPVPDPSAPAPAPSVDPASSTSTSRHANFPRVVVAPCYPTSSRLDQLVVAREPAAGDVLPQSSARRGSLSRPGGRRVASW